MSLMRKELFLVAALTMSVSPAYGQAINAGDISRELEKTLPSLRTEKPGLAAEPFRAPREKGGNALAEDPMKRLPNKEEFGAPITAFYLFSKAMKKDILRILHDRIYNHRTITLDDLKAIRQEVWNLGLRNKKLLHTDFKIVPNPKEDKESWLIVTATEITIRRVIVESDGSVSRPLLDSVKREASNEFYKGKTLDLADLDNTIKTRLRLGDVLLRTSVIPVDEKHIDLKIYVKASTVAENSALIQYDNDNSWTFGRDRLIGGTSFHGMMPGDDLNVMAMKTADMGHFDYGNGIYFARAEYQFPVSDWGVRLNAWASGLHYHEVRRSGGTQANGEALEIGQGITKPVFTGQTTMFDLRADFTAKYTVDRVLETVRTSEKAAYVGRVKALLSQTLGEAQSLQGSLIFSQGTIDLSGERQSLAQDQAGPKVNGLFTKAEMDVTWLGKLGKDSRTDFKLNVKGQTAVKNLDSMEEFSLGGSTGLRAFGSGEASGDAGAMVRADIGYTLEDGTRPFVLYDAGVIKKDIHSWAGQTGRKSYALQDLGVGVSKKVDAINLGVTFAHQVGPNPGLTAQGLDVDNSKQHYRVWASLSYRY